MERHVKERLIGAAVLVAAAVILIPEMLSGSDPQRADEPTPANGEAPLKTYTIDFSKSPATQTPAAPAGTIDDRAPPAEIPATADSAPTPQASPESADAAVAAEPSQSGAVASTALQSAAPGQTQSSNSTPPVAESAASLQAKPTNPSPRAAEPAPSPAKSSSPPPRVAESSATVSQAKPAAAPAAAAGGRWAVQMGSFASRATAEKMVKELRTVGHDAFVMPVKSGAATLYRVRVGPMQDRQSAQQALAKLQAKAPGAAIVPHP